jgi:hypothetical protein
MKNLPALAWATLVASLASMIMLIAVAAKLQVAKEEAAKALADFTTSPFSAIMKLVKGS